MMFWGIFEAKREKIIGTQNVIVRSFIICDFFTDYYDDKMKGIHSLVRGRL
jgi:hypothetical protein